MRWRVERFECDRCKATAERPPDDALEGWRTVIDWPDGRHISDEGRYLCPACADRFQWFMAGGPVLDELETEAPSVD